jgi:hypothetical protein
VRALLEKVKAFGSRSLFVVDEICAYILALVSLMLLAGTVAATAYLAYLGTLWLPNTVVLVGLLAASAACVRAVWLLWRDLHHEEIATVTNLAITTVFSGLSVSYLYLRALVSKVNK